MDELLMIYITTLMEKNTKEALDALNEVINRGYDDSKIRDAASEYARRKKMEKGFSDFLDELDD